MKNKNEAVIHMNANGELLDHSDHASYIKSKYSADTPFLKGAVSYLLMVLCCVIDIVFFRSLFARISYDSPAMIVLEVAGMAFAADIVAAYAGIMAKRIQQGLSHDRFNLVLLLCVPILALIINGILRCTTMSLSTADGTIGPDIIGLTIISIMTPVFTSIGNFAISYQLYDPLGRRMMTEELTLDATQDYCRRLEAILLEAESFDANAIMGMDLEHLANQKKELINRALQVLADTKVMLMEQQKNPTSTNVLSESHHEQIIQRLEQEMETLTRAATSLASAPSVQLTGRKAALQHPEQELKAIS